jgi:hypothetical protein
MRLIFEKHKETGVMGFINKRILKRVYKNVSIQLTTHPGLKKYKKGVFYFDEKTKTVVETLSIPENNHVMEYKISKKLQSRLEEYVHRDDKTLANVKNNLTWIIDMLMKTKTMEKKPHDAAYVDVDEFFLHLILNYKNK